MPWAWGDRVARIRVLREGDGSAKYPIAFMRSALFVDFDNVFSGLMRLGPDYAEAFARNPSRWLNWLIESLEAPDGAEDQAKRRVLVRRCYLNPEPYKRFRIGFSRAGFEIVDCPPMTAAGKTSTDIHMVLDMVDVLQSATRYDEFIVFSADADFTPLLRKLRREDRRTTIFAAGATSASYDASADLIIDPEAFITGALGFDEEDATPTPPNLDTLIAQAEALVWRTVDHAGQPVPLPAMTKILATQVPGLVQTNWAGKGTFYGLLTSLPLEPLRIDRHLNALLDPRRLAPEGRADRPTTTAGSGVTATSKPAPVAADTVKPESAQALAPEAVEEGRDIDPTEVGAMLARELAESDRPIAVARLAQLARGQFPGIEKTWLGCGTWKKLLEQLQGPKLQVVWENQVGYGLDPTRHTMHIAEAPPVQDDVAGAVKCSPEVITWLAAAGLPTLERGRYRILLDGLSNAMGVEPFSLAGVTKLARDRSVAAGKPVNRQHANTVMRGLLFNGFDPTRDGHSTDELVAFLCGMVVSACRREGVKMSDQDKLVLVEWVGT